MSSPTLGADIWWLTLDTLRFDVAQQEHEAGRTPVLSAFLGPGGWERRHTPGSFTLAAHAAFFAGFLPTPTTPGPHERLFALEFAGSTSTGEGTLRLQGASIPEGLARHGYRTVCIGGTGFFNLRTPLGRTLPALFHEQHWSTELGVSDPRSTEHQVDLALRALEADGPLFLFINVSALHQPNCFYLDGATSDSPASQAAALRYVDGALRRLFARARTGTFAVVCSDHGTLYGEDGHTGHRVGHPHVWDVPYGEGVLPPPSTFGEAR